MCYCTLICDVKNSRNISKRQAFQYKLISILEKANNNFNESIASPFIITVGDEWEGLLKYPCNFSEIINFFKASLLEVDFYCGIGIGNIFINDFNLTVNQLDGPAFYRAREALNYAKRKKLPLVILFDDWNSFKTIN